MRKPAVHASMAGCYNRVIAGYTTTVRHFTSTNPFMTCRSLRVLWSSTSWQTAAALDTKSSYSSSYAPVQTAMDHTT
jgi:hypothetical protein